MVRLAFSRRHHDEDHRCHSAHPAEWERWRAQGVTASEAAIILGRSPYKTPWRLWAERTGLARAADLSANPHVQRGNALEDAARRAFEERHDTLLLPLCGESEEHPVLRASFDGIADDGAPVELKVPAERTFAEVAAKTDARRPPSALYWPQVQHQLCVAGAERGWLVFYGGPQRLLEFPVERDEAFLSEELVPACLQFWEAIAKRKEPPRDPARDLYVPVGKALDAVVDAGRRVPGPAAGEGAPRCAAEGEQGRSWTASRPRSSARWAGSWPRRRRA